MKVDCELCGQTCHSQKSLLVHKAKTHLIKYHQCQSCELKFGTKSELTVHVNSIHKGLKYECELCARDGFPGIPDREFPGISRKFSFPFPGIFLREFPGNPILK